MVDPWPLREIDFDALQDERPHLPHPQIKQPKVKKAVPPPKHPVDFLDLIEELMDLPEQPLSPVKVNQMCIFCDRINIFCRCNGDLVSHF